MNALPKQRATRFTATALAILLALSLAGWKFGCQLMALLFNH